jgi:hypothetical protein
MKHMNSMARADIPQGRESTAQWQIDTVAQRKGAAIWLLEFQIRSPGDLADKVTWLYDIGLLTSSDTR